MTEGTPLTGLAIDFPISAMHSRNGFGDLMNFDKKQYKKHYKRIWIPWLSSSILLLWICGMLTVHIAHFWGILSVLGIFGIAHTLALLMELPVAAKHQSQYFSKGKRLFVVFQRTTEYPFVSRYIPSRHREWKYEVLEVQRIKKSCFYLTVCGRVLRKIYDYGDLYDKKYVRKVRIPRVFTNEDLILQMDINKYNETMRKLEK